MFCATRRRRDRSRRGDPGFTLIEIMFAGLVMSITVLGVAASVATSGGMGDRARDEMQARRAIQSWICEIEARPFFSVGYTMHRLAFDVPGLKPQPDDPDGRVGQIVFSSGPVTDTYFVDLAVRWENRRGKRIARSRIVLSEVGADFGEAPSIEALDLAANTRLAAPTELEEILRLGEKLLNGEPSAKWSDPLAVSMQHVQEAQLLLGTVPADILSVVTELEAALQELNVAREAGVDSALGQAMADGLSTVITGLGGGS